jgi:hypothetical protein
MSTRIKTAMSDNVTAISGSHAIRVHGTRINHSKILTAMKAIERISRVNPVVRARCHEGCPVAAVDDGSVAKFFIDMQSI